MKTIKVILLSLCLILPAALVTAAGPLPPNSNAYGKTLTDWLLLYWTWALGGEQAGQVKNVTLLPLPAGTPNDDGVLVGELDVPLRPGTAFVLPVLGLTGEKYADGSVDDPDALKDVIAAYFGGAHILVTLDGKVILDSGRDNILRYLSDLRYFTDPIYYDQPTDYGSVAAIWTQSIGFVHQPLSAGTHTLRVQSVSGLPEYFPTYDNTWHITVAR